MPSHLPISSGGTVARREAIAFPALAAVLTVALYWTTVGYGFYYDDYHFIRPYSPQEIAAAFHGPWDATGIELPYFRPLTVCLFAARFAFLGVNAPAYHVLSLTMFAGAAAVFAAFVARTLNSRAAGISGLVFFIVHPGMPYSAVAWITNQMHLAVLLLVLAGFAWWFFVRRRSVLWWTPLLVLQALAFLLKEDGIMLIPAVLGLHLLRKALVERDLTVPVGFIAASAAVIALLLWWRATSLAGLPTARVPSADQAWANLVRGLSGPFAVVPSKRPFQSAASWFVTVLPLAAVLLWTRLTPAVRYGILAGVLVGVIFDLPFVFLVKAEQLHLVTAGACLTLAAAAGGLVTAAKAKALRAVAVIIVVGGAAAMALVARNIAGDFEPNGPIVLRADRIVQEWAAVPMELRDYLAGKTDRREHPSPNPATALALVQFGLHGPEIDPAGRSLRWMSGTRAEVMLAPQTRLLSIPMRHEIGAFREPARVRVLADGRVVETLTLSDGTWHETHVVLRSSEVSRLARMHRVSIELDRAWIPAQVIPGSGDHRTLGLQVGVIQAR